MNCFRIFCNKLYKTESMNDWLFCEEGVCSIPVVFAFLPSMWPLLWTCTGLCQHLDGEEELSYAPEHTVPFAVRRKGAELSDECRNSSGTTWKLSVLIPSLWLVVNFSYHTTGRAFTGHAHLERKKKKKVQKSPLSICYDLKNTTRKNLVNLVWSYHFMASLTCMLLLHSWAFRYKQHKQISCLKQM